MNKIIEVLSGAALVLAIIAALAVIGKLIVVKQALFVMTIAVIICVINVLYLLYGISKDCRKIEDLVSIQKCLLNVRINLEYIKKKILRSIR